MTNAAEQMDPEGELREDELARRVAFSLMIPLARIANAQGMALREMTHMLRLATFRRMRQRGATLREISEALVTVRS